MYRGIDIIYPLISLILICSNQLQCRFSYGFVYGFPFLLPIIADAIFVSLRYCQSKLQFSRHLKKSLFLFLLSRILGILLGYYSTRVPLLTIAARVTPLASQILLNENCLIHPTRKVPTLHRSRLPFYCLLTGNPLASKESRAGYTLANPRFLSSTVPPNSGSRDSNCTQ